MNEDKVQSLDVYTAIENLEKQLAQLRESVHNLHGRLEPVLSPDCAKKIDDHVKTALVRTPLAGVVDARATTVIEIADLVNETLERLQI